MDLLYDEKLPRGIIPRYRGNRLHILVEFIFNIILSFFKLVLLAVDCNQAFWQTLLQILPKLKCKC